MRGTPIGNCCDPNVGRIIPAHAGNSPRQGRTPYPSPDHPRACGELGVDAARLTRPDGSSPRMRGTHRASGPRCAWRRIIPAHAGNSSSRRLLSAECADHPRACGELVSWLPVDGSLGGSSRACGELFSVALKPGSIPGSSPRMRGTLVCVSRDRSRSRIIPAHAGNSRAALFPAATALDHPRACGELTDAAAAILPIDGSSPRMRGTLRASAVGALVCRIIPAHAGNSSF